MSTATLLAVEAGLVLALVTALWAASVAVRDTSIVDIFWKPLDARWATALPG